MDDVEVVEALVQAGKEEVMELLFTRGRDWHLEVPTKVTAT